MLRPYVDERDIHPFPNQKGPDLTAEGSGPHDGDLTHRNLLRDVRRKGTCPTHLDCWDAGILARPTGGCQLISPEERTDWAQGKDDNYTKGKSHSIGAPLTLAY